MRRVRVLWKVVRAWLAAKRRRKPVAAAAGEVKHPLRVDDEEYVRVMKELDEVLSGSVSPATTAEISPL